VSKQIQHTKSVAGQNIYGEREMEAFSIVAKIYNEKLQMGRMKSNRWRKIGSFKKFKCCPT